MIKDEDLAYIKANTTPEQHVEFVNTGIDNNGRWFTWSSTEGALQVCDILNEKDT